MTSVPVEPAEHAEHVQEHFRAVPKDALPPGRTAAIVEIDGHLNWLIREDEASPALLADLNVLAEHIVRHGLWTPQRGSTQPPRMRHAS